MQQRASLSLLFFLARKGLSESRVTMALLIVAVAAGVGFQIPNTANMLGYRAELMKEGIDAGLGDVRVRPRKGSRFDDADAIAARIARFAGVRAAIAVLTLPGAVGRADQLTGAPVVGIDGNRAAQPFRMIEGQMPRRGDNGGLVLGSALARRIDAHVGDTVRLRVMLASGPTLLPEEDIGRFAMEVRGICAGTFGAYESVFVDRTFLTEEAGTPGAGSMVLVYADDHDQAGALAARIAPDVPEAQVLAWMDDSAYLSSAVRANAAVGAVSRSMVVLAVAIPVLALLYIHVLNRRRDVGLLSALGFGQHEVFLIFLAQALVIGVLGAAAGCGIGYALARYFQAHPLFEWEGFVIRPVLGIECFLQPVAVVLAATLVAGVYPAWRAARIDPARALRGLDG